MGELAHHFSITDKQNGSIGTKKKLGLVTRSKTLLPQFPIKA